MSKFTVVRIGRQAFYETKADAAHIQCFCFLRFENSLVACENGRDALRKYRRLLANWTHEGHKPQHLMASTGSVFTEDQRQYRIHHTGQIWQLEETEAHLGSLKRG